MRERATRDFVIALVVVALNCGGGFAVFNSNDSGTAAAQFLKLGAGARAAGMGEAFCAMADDATAVYWNPAGLAKLDGRHATFMHAVWFENTSYDWLSYTLRVSGYGTVGIGVEYLSYGKIPEINASGSEVGSFAPSDLALMVSYGCLFQDFSVGASAKYISSKIEESAQAYAVDAGILRNVLNEQLSLGAVVQNLGTKMKFSSEEDPLPLNIKLGAAFLLESAWVAAFDVNFPVDNSTYYSIGTEYRRVLTKEVSADGRLGYMTRNKDTGGTNGISVGFGVTYLGYVIDYAFAPYGNLGDTHRISLSINFK